MISAERRSEILHQNAGTSDCGVVAVSAVTSLPRSEASEVLSRYGYTDSGGSPRGSLELALHELGWTTRKLPVGEFDGETAATFAMTHDDGVYLLYNTQPKRKGGMAGHVMALVEGDLYNAIANGRVPLDGVTEVTR